MAAHMSQNTTREILLKMKERYSAGFKPFVAVSNFDLHAEIQSGGHLMLRHSGRREPNPGVLGWPGYDSVLQGTWLLHE